MKPRTINVLICAGGVLLLAGLARGLYLSPWIVTYRYIESLCKQPGVREALQREPEVWQPSPPEGTRVSLGWYSVCLANTDVTHAKVARGGMVIDFGDGLAMTLIAPSGTGMSPASSSSEHRFRALMAGKLPVTWGKVRGVPRDQLKDVCEAAMMKATPYGYFGTALLEARNLECIISLPDPEDPRHCSHVVVYSKRSGNAAGMYITGPDAARIEEAVRTICASLEFQNSGRRIEDVSLDDVVQAIGTWIPSERIEVPDSEREKPDRPGAR